MRHKCVCIRFDMHMHVFASCARVCAQIFTNFFGDLLLSYELKFQIICKNAAVRVFFAVTVEVQKLFLSASCTAYEFVGWLDELEIS